MSHRHAFGLLGGCSILGKSFLSTPHSVWGSVKSHTGPLSPWGWEYYRNSEGNQAISPPKSSIFLTLGKYFHFVWFSRLFVDERTPNMLINSQSTCWCLWNLKVLGSYERLIPECVFNVESRHFKYKCFGPKKEKLWGK